MGGWTNCEVLCTYIRTYVHTHTHTHIHKQTHTHTHTQTHTQTHTHPLPASIWRASDARATPTTWETPGTPKTQGTQSRKISTGKADGPSRRRTSPKATLSPRPKAPAADPRDPGVPVAAAEDTGVALTADAVPET